MSGQYLSTHVIWCDHGGCHTCSRGAQGEPTLAVRQRSRQAGWVRPAVTTADGAVIRYVDYCPTHAQEKP